MSAPTTETFSLTQGLGSESQQDFSLRYLGLGGGLFFVGLLAFETLTHLHSDLPSPGFLFVYGAGAFFVGVMLWFALVLGKPGPDSLRIDAIGIHLSRKGKTIRELRWDDPGFTLELTDLTGDPRANSLPKVPLYVWRPAKGATMRALDPVCFVAIVNAATARGMRIDRVSAARYHFPGGEILTIGPAITAASPAG